MAKKSMIEREKKRIMLVKKYQQKRMVLLDKYNSTRDYNLKLEIHSEIQKLPRNSAKFEFEIVAGRQVVHVAIIGILEFLVMF